MKRFGVLFLILVFPGLLFAPGLVSADRSGKAVFQYSPISALMEGLYDGTATFGDLKKHGDFGLGTCDGLDGEMIGLEGRFYRIAIDGKAYPISDAVTTPFAVVTFFTPGRELFLDHTLTLSELEKYLDRLLPTANIFYAIKMEGSFRRVTTRSVPRQKKPYRRLADAVKDQRIFELGSVRGSLVGFRSPDYIGGVNVPGYHFHFITADRKAGGHVLDLRIGKVKAQIQEIHELIMKLPQDGPFYHGSLGEDKKAELDRVEKEKK